MSVCPLSTPAGSPVVVRTGAAAGGGGGGPAATPRAGAGMASLAVHPAGAAGMMPGLGQGMAPMTMTGQTFRRVAATRGRTKVTTRCTVVTTKGEDMPTFDITGRQSRYVLYRPLTAAYLQFCSTNELSGHTLISVIGRMHCSVAAFLSLSLYCLLLR